MDPGLVWLFTMFLMTQTFPILSLQGDSTCDHKVADVTLSTMSSQARRKCMGAKRTSSSRVSLLSRKRAFQVDHLLICH